MAPPQGYGATAKRKRSSASHMETKQDLRPEENHSRSGSARSTSWAECRNKKGSAPSRRGDVSLDIPFYRTFPVRAAGTSVRLLPMSAWRRVPKSSECSKIRRRRDGAHGSVRSQGHTGGTNGHSRPTTLHCCTITNRRWLVPWRCGGLPLPCRVALTYDPKESPRRQHVRISRSGRILHLPTERPSTFTPIIHYSLHCPWFTAGRHRRARRKSPPNP